MHRHRGDEPRRLGLLDELGKRTGTPLVAVNDVLYHAPERRPLADVVTCIREKCTIAEAGFRLAVNAERHLKPPAEMARLFAAFPDAIARTVEIAEACQFSLGDLKNEYPDEPVPPGKTAQQHLEDLAWQGARRRYPDGVPQDIRDTLAEELAMIARLDYARYFLTVHDVVAFARNLPKPILCQGRGSAANSAVCYCLGITEVNPDQDQAAVRPLHLGEPRRAARHRRRFRARAARGGDPAHLSALRAGPRGHLRNRHPLPLAPGHPRGRQGDGADAGRDRRARQDRVGTMATNCPTPMSARPASTPTTR